MATARNLRLGSNTKTHTRSIPPDPGMANRPVNGLFGCVPLLVLLAQLFEGKELDWQHRRRLRPRRLARCHARPAASMVTLVIHGDLLGRGVQWCPASGRGESSNS